MKTLRTLPGILIMAVVLLVSACSDSLLGTDDNDSGDSPANEAPSAVADSDIQTIDVAQLPQRGN